MKSVLTNRLNYLRARLHADFGDTDAQTVWLKTGEATYTKIRVLQTRSRPARADLAGMNTLATGAELLFVKKSEWPAAKLGDTFLLGPPSDDNASLPHPSNEKYEITGNPSFPQLDWIRIEAQRH